MAQKRMFDKRITDSDKFIDLPNSTKALYFMAGMSADDRGFFQPRRLQKECGFTDDDYKILIAKKFFITFESGVMVITDWTKNNYLDSNRITETEYIEELKMLQVINGKYELTQEALMLNVGLTSVKPTFNQNSIVENSIEQNRVVAEEEKEEETATANPKKDEVMDFYLNNINSTPVSREVEVIESYQKELPADLIIYAMEKAVDNRGRNLAYIKKILNTWKQKGITTLAEAKEEKKERSQDEPNRVRENKVIDYSKFYWKG